jgi:hypothetical protein
MTQADITFFTDDYFTDDEGDICELSPDRKIRKLISESDPS